MSTPSARSTPRRPHARSVHLATTAAVVGALLAATAAVPSGAAPSSPPLATGQPVVTGTPRVGETLRTTRGSWTGTAPLAYQYRWYRCQGPGAPDASDCARISGASRMSYRVRDADVGFRIRSQVVATNAEGSATSTSNPTEVVRSARPLNVSPPTIAGAAAAGSTLTAAAGEWVGTTPITYSFRWLRCDPTGSRCVEIPRATGTSYLLAQEDVGATMRVRVTARNDAGAASALSPQTGVVQPGVPPTGPIPATSLQPGGDQLVVSRVVFSPTPVTSRRAPIVVRILVSARAGCPVSGVTVFVRATPRVAQGQSALTDTNGWATLTLVPNARFPKPKAGYNVQFFVRAYRVGDATRNLDGYRLVQVPLAG